MNRLELVREVAKRADVPLDSARRFINVMDELVMEVIALEDEVRFAWGAIGGKTRKARVGTDPKTHKKIIIPEKAGQPYYKPSKKAKE